MTIYFTAKDIEELAAQGIRQLEVGPGVTLTDFARETARQLNITLVDSRKKAPPSTAPAPPRSFSSTPSARDKYNKPTGCQHSMDSLPSSGSQGSVKGNRSPGSADSNTVNRLIDLMGEAIKRGE
ncbi:MAG: hypothetical protein ACK2T4_03890 [Candidatus Promineifilaceae bacterium]|jgi:hypothetical protein